MFNAQMIIELIDHELIQEYLNEDLVDDRSLRDSGKAGKDYDNDFLAVLEFIDIPMKKNRFGGKYWDFEVLSNSNQLKWHNPLKTGDKVNIKKSKVRNLVSSEKDIYQQILVPEIYTKYLSEVEIGKEVLAPKLFSNKIKVLLKTLGLNEIYWLRANDPGIDDKISEIATILKNPSITSEEKDALRDKAIELFKEEKWSYYKFGDDYDVFVELKDVTDPITNLSSTRILVKLKRNGKNLATIDVQKMSRAVSQEM